MAASIDQAKNYFDLNGLSSITLQSKSEDAEAKKGALDAAAKQFEAIFMQMLLKSMRSAQDVLEADSPFNSETSKFYRDMHDQQLAVELSSNGSLGLSDLIVRQLGGGDENYKPSSVLRTDNQSHVFNTQNNDGISLKQKSLNPFDSSLKESNDSNTQHELSPQLTRLLSKNKQSAENNIETPFNDLLQLVKEQPRFETPKDFVTAIREPAKKVEDALGIPHQVVIAQAALETGWGQKIIENKQGESSNNLFNIKADSRWSGDKVTKETLEFENGTVVKKPEPFRIYSTLNESVNDYIDFLSDNPRYQQALEKVNDVEQFLHGIQEAGYATDPKYAEKIMGTLKRVKSFLE